MSAGIEQMSGPRRVIAAAVVGVLGSVGCGGSEPEPPDPIWEVPFVFGSVEDTAADASVQVRVGPADEEPTLETTVPQCTATHIGAGNYVTANHCLAPDLTEPALEEGLVAPGQIFDQADLEDGPEVTYSVWTGEGRAEELVGEADHVIATADPNQDIALMHVSGGEDLPTVEVAGPNHAPTATDPIRSYGYPDAAHDQQIRHELLYIDQYRTQFVDDNGQPIMGGTFRTYGASIDFFSDSNVGCKPGSSGAGTVTFYPTEAILDGVLSTRTNTHYRGVADEHDVPESRYTDLCWATPVDTDVIAALEEHVAS